MLYGGMDKFTPYLGLPHPGLPHPRLPQQEVQPQLSQPPLGVEDARHSPEFYTGLQWEALNPLSTTPSPDSRRCNASIPDILTKETIKSTLIKELDTRCANTPFKSNPHITDRGIRESKEWGDALIGLTPPGLRLHLVGGEKGGRIRYRHFETALAAVNVGGGDNIISLKYHIESVIAQLQALYKPKPIKDSDGDHDGKRCNGLITLLEQENGAHNSALKISLDRDITSGTPSQKEIKKKCGATGDQFKRGGILVDVLRNIDPTSTVAKGLVEIYPSLSKDMAYHKWAKDCVMSERDAYDFSQGLRKFITTNGLEKHRGEHVITICSDTACNSLRTILVQLHDDDKACAHPLGYNGIALRAYLDKDGEFYTICPNCKKKLKHWKGGQKAFHDLLTPDTITAGHPLYALHSPLPIDQPPREQYFQYASPHLETEPPPGAECNIPGDAHAVITIARHASRHPTCKDQPPELVDEIRIQLLRGISLS